MFETSGNCLSKGGQKVENLSVSMPDFILPIFGGLKLTMSVPIAWSISAIIIIFAIVARIAVSRFTEIPKPFQNLLELIVETAEKASFSKLDRHGKGIAPYILLLGLFIGVNTLYELLGIKPAISSLSTTFAMALISFFWINYLALRAKGLRGRVKSFFQPVAIMAPIKVVTDLAIPVSLACRLFGNVTAGIIIMGLIYPVIPIFVPAIMSAYFNLFHMGIQAYIFITLTLTFAQENTETLE
jgi:F-type H+-transporting ATPase subunit a